MNVAPVRLGMLTPSSNTALEPLTAALLAGAPHVSAHFARLRVTEIALSEAALGQFDHAPQLAAADLLADAKVHAIAWNGTAGGWRGFDADHTLCAAIAARTGVAATTATLATLDALAAFGARRIAFVTPYLAEVQAAIVRNFNASGFDVVAERHLGDRGNFSFATFGEDVIAAMIREVAAARPDAIVIYCTNFRGTRIAPVLEAETAIPILDSIAVTLWGALRAAGADPAIITGWGRLFGRSPATPPIQQGDPA